MNKRLVAVTAALFLCAAGTAAFAHEGHKTKVDPGADGNTAGGDVVKSGKWKMTLPVGLPGDKYLVPKDNPMSKEKIELGKLLFFDKRLSLDDTVACADCHSPARGFSDPNPVSTGVGGAKGSRHAPTVINRAFTSVQMWDGRKKSLEDQATGPIANPVEMKQPDLETAAKKIAQIKGYKPKFKKVFGHEANIDDIARAIAAFERTVVSGNSKWDRYQAGDEHALNSSEKKGWELFTSKARCTTCHNGFNFSDEEYHNIGVGMTAPNPDLGRSLISKVRDDEGAFKTPTLRDISARGPYMHDGSEKTLEDVIDFYNKGGNDNPNLSPLIDKLGLTDGERADLLALLKALDGQGWKNITPPTSFPK